MKTLLVYQEKGLARAELEANLETALGTEGRSEVEIVVREWRSIASNSSYSWVGLSH